MRGYTDQRGARFSVGFLATLVTLNQRCAGTLISYTTHVTFKILKTHRMFCVFFAHKGQNVLTVKSKREFIFASLKSMKAIFNHRSTTISIVQYNMLINFFVHMYNETSLKTGKISDEIN